MAKKKSQEPAPPPPAEASGEGGAGETPAPASPADPTQAGLVELPLWRCHVHGQPDGVFGGADETEAIGAYKQAYGILASDHPFRAERIAESADAPPGILG